jgi:zinc protease
MEWRASVGGKYIKDMLLRLFALLMIAMTAFAAEKKIFPYNYDQHDFENGLRLITVPTDYPNVVALYIVVQAGSRNEVEPGKSGFAHLFEHIMFRGTEKFPPEKYEAALKEAGAASNAFTDDDLTVYHTAFTKADLEAMLAMEADRFQNLKYPESAFKTETRAVLGEYNKNSANPVNKLCEVLQDTAFDKHTYKHTTMGFLKDIENMPNLYEYSRQFFDRYYRPEYTSIIVVGDVDPKEAQKMVEKHWGEWKRGGFKPEIPAEPPQEGPRQAQVDWPTQTLPWLAVAYRGAAYMDAEKDSAALDVLSFVGFSENSPLYQKLVIEEQKVDQFFAFNPDHVDPYLFAVVARLKDSKDMDYVRDQILSTIEMHQKEPVEKERLETVKKHLRYSFALGMDNNEAIARTLAHYVALRRTPETINKIYDLYAEIAPEDVNAAANKYLIDNRRTIVTLTSGGEK